MSHKHDHEKEDHIFHECDAQGHEHHHHEDGSCCCHKHEVEFHGIEKGMLARLIISALIYLCGMFIPAGEKVSAGLFVVSGLIAGYDIIVNAVKNTFVLRFFDEYFLMSFAAVAACIIGEYEEGAAVFILYRIGETCQNYAIRHSRRRLSAALPDHHTHAGKESGSEEFITRFSRAYTPIILILACIITAVLPVFGSESVSGAVYRSLNFLVLACPCAIVISVPMTYSAGIAAAAAKGIYFASSTSIDLVASKEPGIEDFESAVINEKTSLLYSSVNSSKASEAEMIIIGEDESGITLANKAAKNTKQIVLENVVLVVGVKLIALVLAALGKTELWFSVFADSGVTILAVLNSLKALYLKTK